jgi:hypothetical protein
MRFFFITSSPDLAAYAVARGVDRIFVDLEINGKVERQGHLSTVISRHNFEDVAAVRAAIPSAELMVRVNPVFEGSREEVERAIGLGADILMLPMFRSPDEVRTFSGLVRGRARTSLLVETVGAMQSLVDIVKIEGVDEVHIGLNDLHLELGNDFMFEPLANGLVDAMAQTIQAAGLPFGIGGVARLGEGLLPAEIVLAEHVRLGSTAAILSRTFHRNLASRQAIDTEMSFSVEIARLRAQCEEYRKAPRNVLDQIHRDLQERVRAIVESKQVAEVTS